MHFIILFFLWSPKSKYLICGSEDHFVYIWKTQHEFYKFSSARRDRNDYWEISTILLTVKKVFKFQFVHNTTKYMYFFILTYKRIYECLTVFVVRRIFLQFIDNFTMYIFYVSCFILSFNVLLVCFSSQFHSYSCCICSKPVTLYSLQE